MPCYSRITTKMTDTERLAESLRALGFEVKVAANMVTGTAAGKSIRYEMVGGAYSIPRLGSYGVTKDDMSNVGRKYAELGVRAFARSRGFSVTESTDRSMTLVNRRS